MKEQADAQAYWKALQDIQEQQEKTEKCLTRLDEQEDQTNTFAGQMRGFLYELGSSWRGEEDNDTSSNADTYRELSIMETELEDVRRASHSAIEQERERLDRLRQKQGETEETIIRTYKEKLSKQAT